MSESSKLVWRNLATNCNLHVHNGQVKEYFTKIPIYFSLYFLNTHHSAKRTQVFIEESSFSKFANAEETLGRGWNGYFVWSFPHLECARAKMTFTTPIKQPSAKSSSSKNLLLQHITECFIVIWNENFRFIRTDVGGFLYYLLKSIFRYIFYFGSE